MRQTALVLFLLGLGCAISQGPLQAQDTEFVEEHSWRFDNFQTFEDLPWTGNLSWELYRDTFIGIPPTQSVASSGFDVAFYTAIFERELTEPGNCFGMILLSYLIQEKGHHLGLCAPVRQYEGDNTGTGVDLDGDGNDDDVDGDGSVDTNWTRGPTGSDSTEVRRAINRMHGHQINLPTLRHLMDILQQHANRDGNFAFEQARKYIEKEGAAPISVTQSLSPQDGGHALLAYDTRVQRNNSGTVQTKEIFVYDPNRPWNTADSTWYQNGNNVITIDAQTGEWTFDMAGPDTWSGEPAGGGGGVVDYSLGDVLGGADQHGGNLVVIPASVTAPKARGPGSLGLSAPSLANTIAIYGDGASIEGASSPDGPLDNVVPWYPSDTPPDGGRYDFGVYVVLGEPEETIDLEVQSGENGYQLTLAGPNSHLDIQSKDATGTDVLSIENLGSARPGLGLRSASGAPYRIAFHQQNMTVDFERETRSFVLPEFRPPSEASVHMRVGGAGENAFSVQSPEVDLQYDLQVERVVGDDVQTLTQQDLQVPAGRQQVIQPKQWQSLREGALQIQEQQLVEPRRIDVNEQIDVNQ